MRNNSKKCSFFLAALLCAGPLTVRAEDIPLIEAQTLNGLLHGAHLERPVEPVRAPEVMLKLEPSPAPHAVNIAATPVEPSGHGFKPSVDRHPCYFVALLLGFAAIGVGAAFMGWAGACLGVGALIIFVVGYIIIGDKWLFNIPERVDRQRIH